MATRKVPCDASQKGMYKILAFHHEIVNFREPEWLSENTSNLLPGANIWIRYRSCIALRGIAVDSALGYTSMLHQPQKVGFASNIFQCQNTMGFHCKSNGNFEQMKSIFGSTTYRCRWKLIFWGFKVPISTIDWWNMSFQLPRNPEIRDLIYFQN